MKHIWRGNYETHGHVIKALVTDKAMGDWIANKPYYLDIAGKALDVSTVCCPDYPAVGVVAGIDARFFRVYPVQGVDGIGMLYYSEQRTSRKGLYIVDCEYRAVIFPCGISISEMTAGDGYL